MCAGATATKQHFYTQPRPRGSRQRAASAANDTGRYMARTLGRGLELEPLERLEEKVRMLVGHVERLRAEHADAIEENGRLRTEIEGLRTRLTEVEEAGQEIAALREERDHVRARVAEILDQLEAIQV
jgi:regulator of replication initiation timing